MDANTGKAANMEVGFEELTLRGTVTVSEYCRLLQRSRSSAIRDIKAGRVKAIRVGGSIRILVSSVSQLLTEGAA